MYKKTLYIKNKNKTFKIFIYLLFLLKYFSILLIKKKLEALYKCSILNLINDGVSKICLC